MKKNNPLLNLHEEYSSPLKKTSKIYAITKITALFAIHNSAFLLHKNIVDFLTTNEKIYWTLFTLLSTVNIILFLCFLTTETISRRKVDFGSKKNSLLYTIFFVIIKGIFEIYEYFLYSLKIIIFFSYYFISKNTQILAKIFFYSWIAIDISTSLGIINLKLKFLECYDNKKSVFSKIKGNFEFFFYPCLTISIGTCLFDVAFIRFIAWIVFSFAFYMYYTEMPYYDKIVRRVFTYFFLFSIIFNGIFLTEKFRFFEIFLMTIFLTFLVKFSLDLVIRKNFNLGFIQKKNKKKILIFLKEKIIEEKSDFDELKIMKEKGEIQNIMQNPKSLKEKNLWRDFIQQKNEDFSFNFKIFLVETLIEIDKKDNYFRYLKLLIMREKPKLSIILKTLKKMKDNQGLENQYFYSLAKNEIYTDFSIFYKSPNFSLKKLDFTENEKKVNNFRKNLIRNLRNILGDRTPLVEAILYNEKKQKLEDLVFEFAYKNKKFIKLLSEKSLDVEVIDKIITELHHIHKKILYNYRNIENIFNEGNISHLLTYQNYLKSCVNFKKTGQEIHKKINKRRSKNSYIAEIFKKTYFESESENNKNKGFIIFATFDGKIKNSFGKTGIKNFEIPKKIEDFIPDINKKGHQEVFENFVNKKFDPSLLGHGNGFINIEKNFILPVKFHKKILPFSFLEEDILLAASILIEKNDQNCYIILEEDSKVSAVSYNYKNLFNERYVKNIKDVNEELYNTLKCLENKDEDFEITNEKNKNFRNKQSTLSENGCVLKTTGVNTEEKYIGEFNLYGLRRFSLEVFLQKKTLNNFEYKILRLEIQEEDEYEAEIARRSGILDDSCVGEEKILIASSARLVKQNTFNTLKNIDSYRNRDNTHRILDSHRIIDSHRIENLENKIINEEILEEDESEKEGEENEDEFLINEGRNSENSKKFYSYSLLIKAKSEKELKIREDSKKNLSEPSKKNFTFDEEDNELKKKYYNFEDIVKKGWSKGKINFLKLIFFMSTVVVLSFIFYIGSELTKSSYEYVIESHLVVLADELKFQSENFYGNLLLADALVQGKIEEHRYEGFYKKKKIEVEDDHTDEEDHTGEEETHTDEEDHEDHNEEEDHAHRILLYSRRFLQDSEHLGHNHGGGDINLDQDYDVGDLHSYLNYTFKYSSELVKVTLRNLLANINEIHLHSDLGGEKLIRVNMTETRTDLKGKIFTQENSIFQNLMLQLISKIMVIDHFDEEDFEHEAFKSRTGISLKYLEENMLNGINLAFKKFSSEFSDLLEKKYYNFTQFILLLTLILTGIMVVFSAISIALVLKIRTSILRIYKSVMNLREKKFKKRLENLNFIIKKNHEKDSKKEFSKENFIESLRSTKKSTGLFVKKNFENSQELSRKYLKKRKQGCYKIGLKFPIITIIIFYSSLTLISFFSMKQFESKASSRVLLTKKILLIDNLVQNQFSLITAIKQFIILGPEKKISGRDSLEYIKELNNKLQNESKKVREISDFSSNPELRGVISDFLENIEKKSLCEITPSLVNDLEFCTKMDNGIPAQGYTQSYFRISKFLRETVERLSKENTEKNFQILEEEEFRIVEYMISNVYYPSFFFISTNSMDILLVYISDSTTSAKNNVFIFVLFSLIFGWGFVIFSFGKIHKKLDQAVFVFRCVDLDQIVGNSITRLKFFEIYGLRRNLRL